jgi:hypothetical protein
MKKYLSFILLFGSLVMQAQFSEQVRLEWFQVKNESAEHFKGEAFLQGNFEVPFYCGTTASSVFGNFNVQVTVVETEAVSPYMARLLAQEELGFQPKITSNNTSYKGSSFFNYCIQPFVKRNGQYLRLKSFRVSGTPAAETTSARSYKTSGTAFKQSSVLSGGDWFKLAISKTDMYKITPAFLNELGMKSASISSLRLVGNGTGILPEHSAVSRPDDLEDVPFKVVDNNNNGQFDGSDYLVFYGKGPHTWSYNNTDSLFTHTQNIYRDKNYYFISASGGGGPQVTQASPVSGSATVNFNHYVDYQFIEDELTNLVGTGRVWVGDVFDFTRNRNYSFSFTDIDQSFPVKLRVNAVGRASTGNTRLEVSYNGQQLMANTIGAYPTFGDYPAYVVRSDERTQFTAAAPNNITLNLNYNNTANPAGVVWLDFIEVQLRRNMVYRNKPLFFRNTRAIGAGAIAQYTLSDANASVEVWDITEHNNPQRIPTQVVGNTLVFSVAHDALRQYVAFSGSSFPLPEGVGPIANQNLHALGEIDMLVVTHRNFKNAAVELADFHRETDNMIVEVVDVEEVYNEFSSGGQDISAIRDMARMLYERSNAASGRFKYLLLMGDASYDYKNRITGNDNFVPIYEDPYSFSLGNSIITDDFYALLDPNEGNQLSIAQQDIGVGRIPSRTSGQADAYVKKVKAYANSAQRFGDWRNRILLIADDMDDPFAWEDIFITLGSEPLEVRAKNASSAYNIDKVYADAYRQVSTTGRQSYPEASRDIFRKVQQGNLVTNYIGHGGEIGLASEGLIDLQDVNAWTNIDAMPLFVTITCEFTRVDDPKRVSAGEQLLHNSKGGAIGLISTTRVVGAVSAINLNRSVFDTLLSRPNNLPLTLGEIIRYAKNDQSANDATKLKFSLFGDPALRLAIPIYNVQTNAVNGVAVSSNQLDTLKAQNKVTISGQVNDFNNQLIPDFNGVLDVSVFDKPSERNTLQNDPPAKLLRFEVQNNLIYRGKVSVVDGLFSFTFIVPKDIAFKYGNGKISYYAHNSVVDAAGSFDSIVVGGFNNAGSSDKTGPEVALYMNDESFVRGGITSPDPELYAIVSDSSGVNTVGSSVGHDLVAVLDGKTDQSYVLNEYYEADLDSYQSGKVRYPFFDLETGEHTLELKVFDVFNNFSISQTEFIVAEDENLVLRQVLNYPNPFTTYTEFQFEHNRANVPLQIQVQVFTVSGQLVKTINTTVTPTGNRVTGVAWDGLDDYGDKIGKGVYVYRVKVNSPTDNSSAEEYEKLVILR